MKIGIKTKTIEYKVYIALDGQEFEDKDECILYEKKIKSSRSLSKCKDWNEDIKESLGHPGIPSEEHPQYIIRDEVFSEIKEYALEIKEKDISHSKLNTLFKKCNTNDTEQTVEYLKQLSALSLCLASNEYRQIGDISEKAKLLTRLHDGFKAYENRGKFNNRLFDIKNELEHIGKYQSIICKNEKKDIAKRYEVIADHCLKAIITIEIQQQKQEQKQIIVMS